MGVLDWFRGNIQTLDLKKATFDAGSSRMALPRVPWPLASPDSLYNYTRKSEIVYACIEKKAQAATDPEIIVEQKNSQGEWEPIDDHPAVALLKRPNPYEDGETFLRAWIASENTDGTFYAEKVMSRAGTIAELYPLIPTLVVPFYRVTDRGNELEYYEYQTGVGKPIRFYPDELLVRRRHSRGSIFSGLSPLQVALGTVDADIAATEYVRAFFNNDGTPSGILKISGRRLSDDDAQHLRQRWQSNYSRHGKNRGGVAVLDDSAEYQPIGAKLNELESESLTSIDESRICMAFGVPPILIGAYVGLVHVNQRASVREAQQDFWMNTMSPELKQIRHWLTWFVLPYFEDYEKIRREQIRFNWDMSQVDALQEDVDQIAKRVRENYKYGVITLNEARENLKLDPVEGEDGDAFYKPTAVAEPDDEEEPDPPKQLKAADIIDAEIITTNGHHSKKNFEYQGMILAREPSELEKSIDLKSIYESYESGRESLAKVIQTMRTDLIKQAVNEVGSFGDGDIHTLTLSPPPFAQKSVTREIRQAVEAGRRQVSREAQLAKGLIDDLIKLLVDATISQVINEVSSAAINIFTALRKLGLDRDEVEQRLDEELILRSEKSFDRIAQGTINEAVNAGRREEMAARADDIDRYVYSAIMDANTCDPCADWDGKEAADPDELPETPNEECLGQSSCRCFIISVFATEAQ
jgi:HK97 family phage portal protein